MKLKEAQDYTIRLIHLLTEEGNCLTFKNKILQVEDAINNWDKKIFILRTVIDSRTPDICRVVDGLEANAEANPPHDTGDPNNLCRCWIEEKSS